MVDIVFMKYRYQIRNELLTIELQAHTLWRFGAMHEPFRLAQLKQS